MSATAFAQENHPIYRDLLPAHGALTALRRELHGWPELGFEETRTAQRVCTELDLLGIPYTRGVGVTGVVGVVAGQRTDSGRAVGLRADMDALALCELNRFEHASQRQGLMHACGHDGHTAMLLGAARHLARHRDFNGTVYLIFQPAEEGRGGAQAMIDEGLFERFPADEIYALHNSPVLPVGTVAVAPGACLSSADMFTLRIHGRGGHGAHPHLAADAVLAAAQVITALQGIVARNVPPMENAVLSVCALRGGDFEARNVLPDTVEIGGTVRTFSTAVQDLIQRRIAEVAQAVAEAHGATAELHYTRLFPPTVSTEREARFAAQVAARLVGPENVRTEPMPSTASEDFSCMLLCKPGAYLRVGQGGAEERRTLHNPHYDFNDEILPLGASLLAALAKESLPLAP
ncbi:MAG: amidohydrolase [Pseudomonadota bacterium]